LPKIKKRQIFEYWNDRNKSKTYSKKLNFLFDEAAEMLLLYPDLGKMTNYKNIRIKLVRDYWIVYRLIEPNIQVLAIWDTRKNPEDFKNLLNQIS
jgi:hypothetical protein